MLAWASPAAARASRRKRALAGPPVGQARDLQGDGALQEGVVGQVDLAHAALAQQPLDAVAAEGPQALGSALADDRRVRGGRAEALGRDGPLLGARRGCEAGGGGRLAARDVTGRQAIARWVRHAVTAAPYARTLCGLALGVTFSAAMWSSAPSYARESCH